MPQPNSNRAPHAYVIHLGAQELVIRQRYEFLSIANDILIALWFLVGSFLFFSDSTVYAGTWLFVLGSVEMLIRPLIRLTRHVHLQRYHPHAGSAAAAGNDF
ncbi:hypothetical protein GCE65_04840 [Pseudactinotalea sp. HY158]|nr:YrhK family protein [Pseudactinotalea sp. HY158]QGH68902.1 hypothetical protein GCE65_04840 [Pseudactinotalea sp. HY158]